MTTDPKSLPFTHPENITVGEARVIYGPVDYGWATGHGWHLPGGVTTKNREQAYACAVAMNRAMGGVQVTAI